MQRKSNSFFMQILQASAGPAERRLWHFCNNSAPAEYSGDTRAVNTLYENVNKVS
jgi:hypothetical protein